MRSTRKPLLLLLLGVAALARLWADSGSGNNTGLGKIFEEAPGMVPPQSSSSEPTPAQPKPARAATPSTAPAAPAKPAVPNLLNLVTTQQGIQFSLSYDAFAGYGVGWASYPTLGDFGSSMERSPIFGISSNLGFDARPDSSFRIHGSMYWDFPAYATPFNYTNVSTPAIWEMFADYTFLNTVFFRIGKQIINWGASRFFPIDDLPDLVPTSFQQFSPVSFDNTAGIGVKIGVPIGIDSLSLIAQIKNGYIANPAVPSVKEIGLGAMDDLQLGKTELSLGGYYQKYLTPTALAIFRRTIFGVDTRAEALFAQTPTGGVAISYLANIFWQSASPANFNIEAEYMHNAGPALAYINDSEPGFPTGDALAVLAGFKNIFGWPVNIGVKWEHSFLDNSGLITPGVSYTPFSHISFTLAAPVYYGPSDGEMMLLNPDPLKRAASIGVKVDLSGNE